MFALVFSHDIDRFWTKAWGMIRVVIQQPSLAKYRVPVFRELAARPGIDVHVIYGTRRDLPNVPADGFRATPYPLRFFRLGRAVACYHAPQWTRAARRHCDVLMLTWNARYLSLWPGLLRAHVNRVGTVLWGHGYSKRGTGLNHRLRTSLTNWATALLFYNYETRQRYLEQGFTAQRLFVAMNTLDRAEIDSAKAYWQQNQERLRQWRRDQQITDRPVILYVSRLDPNNRLDWLVQALPAVKAQIPEVVAIIVGGGEENYLNGLRQQAESLGVADAIRFIGPIYDERELAPWFLSAQVFCYPTNIGLSLIHALLYGLPVVTSRDRQRHNPEIEAFAPLVNGLDYSDGAVDDLSAQLVRCLTDSDLRQQLAAGALATVAERFTLREMVDGMEAAIRFAYRS